MSSPQSARSPGIRLGAAALLVAGATALVLAQPPETVPPSGGTFDVTHYTVALDLDVDAGSVTGTERIELTVRDTTASLVFASGLTQLPTQAYTTFATGQWMVAVDAPSDRATLDLELAVPSGWKAAGSGRQLSVQPRGGKTTYRWRQDRAVSSFLYGFVAGAFTEAGDTHRGVTLTYLGSPFSTEELRRIFRHTPAIMAFMEERAGMAYPGDRYTQALVSTSSGQELSGLSHMSEAYGRTVLADATATGWRRRVEQLRAAGHDRPLVFPDWPRPTADDRAVVYQKGALALHELREQLGDAAFWTAVRAYTTAHAGQAVTLADLQRAFEASSGRTLMVFFHEWVRP